MIFPSVFGIALLIVSQLSGASSVPKVAGTEADEEVRIIGGKDAAEGQFPWAGKPVNFNASYQIEKQTLANAVTVCNPVTTPRPGRFRLYWNSSEAALFFNGRFICSSSILGPRTVLTAAHCVVLNNTRQSPSSFFAIANRNKSMPEVRIDFTDIYVQPGYSDVGVDDDLAILTAAVDIPFSDTVSPVCIARPNTPLHAYKNATAMGWGNTKRVGVNIPDILQFVEQKIVPNSFCRWVNSGVDKNKICAKGLFTGVCNGDSGGPLVHLSSDKPPVEIGVASYINGAAGCGSILAAVFTRVSAYYDDIMQNSADGVNGAICTV